MDQPAHAEHGGAFFDAIGADFTHLERRDQIINADVLDAWYDPAPAVIASISEYLPWLVKTSPPTHGEGLVHEIAKSREVAEETILLGSGSSSLIFSVLPQLVKPGDRVLVLDPSYGEYDHLLTNVLSATVVKHPLDPSGHFQPDLDRLAAQVSTSKLTILVNPNSPTGPHLTRNEIQELLRAVPANGTLWVDETYIDFVGRSESVEPLVQRDPRLVVSKSMSKYYALSGLRVGYLLAYPSVAARLAKFIPPWSVGLLAQVAAVEALRSSEYYEARSRETAELRTQLLASLSSIPGVAVFESSANFLLFKSPIGSARLVQRARDHGVFLRNCDSMSERLAGRFVRTAVKDSVANERIAEAIRNALAS